MKIELNMKVDLLVLQTIAISTGLPMKHLSAEKNLSRDLPLSKRDLELLIYDLEMIFEVSFPAHVPFNTAQKFIDYIEQECFSRLEPPPLPF